MAASCASALPQVSIATKPNAQNLMIPPAASVAPTVSSMLTCLGGKTAMKKFVLLIGILSLGGAAAAPSSYPASYPDWAYAVPTPENEAVAPRDDGTVFVLPGSDGHFTRGQIGGAGHKPPADWYPSDHPAMPGMIAAGDAARGITACAACHYPNGKGRPQN